ncbi:MAG: hypothetical protein HPY85_02685 [Anaerolineae bacterium]|nr:hypothetical protein [Anaerolineae bacterium]
MPTSLEIVAQTLNFQSPERVARSFGESDFVWASVNAVTFATDWSKDAAGNWVRLDEWGNRWRRIDETSKGEVVEGVLPSLDLIDQYQFPDFSRPEDYGDVREMRKRFPDHWLIGGLPGFTFNIARKLRRLDHYLLELAADPANIHRLNDRVDQVLYDMIQNYAAAGVDCVMFPEDWGTQLQTLISPRMWRREFLPRFEVLCGLAHQLNLKVFMHSCGQISAIVPDLVRAGIDVLQFDQPDLHGIDQLAAHQAEARITYWCPVDIQTTLQTRSEEVIRAKAREMLEKLWDGRGGFIAGYYTDNESIGLDPYWQQIACDEFIQYGTANHFTGEPRL